MYGLVVGGIRGARIWFGPLTSEICYFQVWATNVMVWYCVLTIFFMSFFKFLYICVWKHMRDMNDDLLVTFIIRLSIFIRGHSSITSSKRWVGGVRKWQFLMIYSTVNHQRGGWVGLKKSKT